MKYIISQQNAQGRVGHQFQNWILGFILSRKFNIEFIHNPFSGLSSKWESVLRFGEPFRKKNDINPKKVIKLPNIDLGISLKYDINKAKKNLDIWEKMIKSEEEETLFVLPFDIFPGFLCEEIYPNFEILRDSYWSNKSKYQFDNNFFNIGIHIRRGDISKTRNLGRWLDLNIYKEEMEKLSKKDLSKKPIKFHIFSEGKIQDFKLISGNNVNFILNGSDIETLRMMSSVDTLVTGLSSFSFLAAYLCECPVYYFKLRNYTRWDEIQHFTEIKYNHIVY